MIKLEVCRCIRPFNKQFQKDELYVLHASKSNGKLTAYLSATEGIPITKKGFIKTNVPFHEVYFKPIVHTYFSNFKEVRNWKQNSMEDFLKLLKNQVLCIKK